MQNPNEGLGQTTISRRGPRDRNAGYCVHSNAEVSNTKEQPSFQAGNGAGLRMRRIQEAISGSFMGKIKLAYASITLCELEYAD